MQTFLPFSSFVESAKVLDNRRLGKQRVEAYQIYNAITNPAYGWQNHPAVKMWRGYEFGIAYYGEVICREWIKRGFRDTLLPKFEHIMKECDMGSVTPPFWLGDTRFHDSHKSQLWFKDPIHYRAFEPEGRLRLSYVWPV